MANKKQVIDEEYELKELNLTRALRVLCLLSAVGFAIGLIIDFSFYTGFGAYLKGGFGAKDQVAFAYQTIVGNMDAAGLDVSKEAIGEVQQMFFYLGVLNIPVMLGVALMFFRVKIGFAIYALCQSVYILLPLFFTGFSFYPVFRLTGYFDIVIMILFILMYGIQSKNLGNPKLEAS